MNRLTRRGKTGQAAPVKRIEVVCPNQTGNANLNEIFEHLASYEDLGLTPEQIREVDQLYAEKCKEVAELQKSPWIPVTERLPKAYDLVLACNRDGYIDIVWGWHIENKQKWNIGDDVNGHDIIAWMPLPKACRERK